MDRVNRILSLVLGAAAFFLPAGGLRAETITLRNDTKVPLVIQTAVVINGQVRVDRPVAVKSGGVTTITLPGNKLITIYNGRNPSQVLNKTNIQASKEDGAYSMQADILPGRVKLEPIKPDAPAEKKDKPEKDGKPDRKRSDKDR
ncbi:MAG: hypothetical protein ACJ8FY_27380 [Gemmataceae bacterium]